MLWSPNNAWSTSSISQKNSTQKYLFFHIICPEILNKFLENISGRTGAVILMLGPYPVCFGLCYSDMQNLGIDVIYINYLF